MGAAEASPPVLSSVTALISNLDSFKARGIFLTKGKASLTKSEATLRSLLTAINAKPCSSKSDLFTDSNAYSSLDKFLI